MSSKEKIRELLKKAGIEISGARPSDIQVHDERFYDRVLSQGSLGVGESYMDGWWDVDDLATFFFKILRSGAGEPVKEIGALWYFLRATFTNMQNKRRAWQVAEEHYDLGNDLYTRMLDSRMIYTCAYWKEAKTLEEAQEAKLDLMCRKLDLKPGETVLDIGCGWGGFAQFAAEKYGVHVTGITISKEQAALARERVRGLPVEIKLEDYRETTGQFDHVVSIGMFEHVGRKNYRTYFKKVRELIKDDGLFLLQAVGSRKSVWTTDRWIHKYIFPNGLLPSVEQLGEATNGLFMLEDWQNFGVDYDKTLLAWYENFERAWPDLQDKYGERFFRMWRYYLLSCAGSFRARYNHLWQIVLSKKGVLGGYQSIR